MKATIEIDATLQEMRELMGLPEVQCLQKEAMEKILVGIESNDVAELMKLYMPMPEQMSAMEGFQKTMWDAMTQSMAVSTPKKK